jgi:hypothetical protein
VLFSAKAVAAQAQLCVSGWHTREEESMRRSSALNLLSKLMLFVEHPERSSAC